MLAVACVGACLVLVRQHGVVVNVNQSEVVTCSEDGPVLADVDAVDVRSVFALGVDAEHVPAKLDSLGGPCQLFGVLCACRVVDLVGDVEVQLFVVT